MSAALALASCIDAQNERPGRLVIATQTDMSVPGGIDTIELRVEVAGEVRHEETFEVAPVGKQKIPFTYTLEAAKEPVGEVTIEVVGLLQGEPRVFAQTITAFPEDERTAVIELPLQWLCSEKVKENKDGEYESSCEPIKDQPAACVAGKCTIANVDEALLPDYVPQNVFGGASKPGSDGACFPTETCFDSPTVVVPNADCQLEFDGLQDQVNVALQLPQDAEEPLSGPGICSASGCFVPLDNDQQTGYTFLAGPSSNDGGADAGASLVHVGLPKAVCEKLNAGELIAVVTSSACATKTTRTPTCGEWSSTTREIEVVLEDVGADAALDANTPDSGSNEAGPHGEITIIAQGDYDGGGLAVGQTIQLILSGTDSDNVVWESSDENVATVTDDGLVEIVGKGTATIKATVDGTVVTFEVIGLGPDEIDVSVVDQLAFLMLDPSEAMIPAGAAIDIAARGTLNDGSTVLITPALQWTSSDDDVATVESGHVVGVQPGVVTIRAEGNNIVAEATITVTDASLQLLTVNPAEITLPAGVVQALVATATYSNGQSLVASNEATWTSGNEDIVTVDEAGLVTAVAVGETLVTAQLDGKTDTVFVHVTDAALEQLAVEPTSLSLYVGQSQTIVATALYSDGQSVDVSRQLAWSSSDEEVATAVVDPTLGVRILGASEGEATITGVFAGQEVVVPVTITAVPLSGLTLEPSTVSLPLGATTAVTLVANYADGQTYNATDDAAWSTEDPNIATILANGTIVAQSVGTVQITARLGELEASTTVTVTDARLLGVSLNPAAVTLVAGLATELVATASYSDGRSVALTTQADWSSSDVSAVVEETGLVRGISPGSSTITVSFGGFDDSCVVTVSDAQLESLRIESEETSVPAGNTLSLHAEATFTDGTSVDVTPNVTWRSENTAVGVVNAAGSFTGIMAGDVSVSATLGQQSASLDLQVTNALPLNIVLTPEQTSLARGTSTVLTAVVEYSDGTSRAPGAGAVWSSLDQAVATVNNGSVTAIAEGSTEVVLSFAGLQGRAGITVTQATPTRLTVTPSSNIVADGQNVTFSALVTYSDGTSSIATSGVTWRSLTPEVATINANSGVALTVAPGTASVQGTFGTLVDSATFAVTLATVATLEITPESVSVARGNSAQLEVRATYTDGTSSTVTAQARIASADTSIATVNQTGLARGVAAGTTTVNASFGGVNAAATITVTNAILTGLTVLPGQASVAAGTSQLFIAEAEYSDGTAVIVSPMWSTSNSDVATVNSRGEARGRRTGTANIIASFEGRQAQAPLTVTNAVIVGITLVPSNPEIPSGTTRQFTATATYSDGTTGPVTATFSSSNTERLQINSATGLARGSSPGNVTVTATAQGSSSSTTAQVTAGTLDSLSVTPDGRTVPAGNTVTLSAAATYTDGRSVVVTSAAAWRTSDPAIARVQGGVVTTHAPGDVIITADFGGETARVTLSVSSAVVTRVTVEPLNGNVTSAPLGENIALAARATYSDGTSALVTPVWTATSAANTLPFTVSNTGVARAVALGTATITATFSGVAGSLALTATDAVIVGLTIDPTSATVIVGTNRQFNASATYSDGATVDVNATATWTSSNGNFANVRGGLTTGIAPGAVTVRAAFGGLTATSNVTVVAASVTAVTVTSPSGTSVPAGLTRNLVATATYDNGTTQEVTTTATWSSSAGSVLQVSASGVATGVTTGNATVSASFQNRTGTLALAVTAAQLTGLRMDPTSIELPSGRNATVRLIGSYTDGSEQTLTTAATWTSADADVASYEAGRVFAGDPGSTTITASTGGRTARLSVAVSDAVVDSVTVTPGEGNVPAGNTMQLQAEANYSDGRTVNVTSEATWTSGSPTTATVTAGLVRGVAAGSSALISAAFGGRTATATIAVTSAVVTRVVVDPNIASIAAGTSRQLTARAIYSNGTESNVTSTATWARASGTSASVNSTGLVSGGSPGIAVVSATFGGVTGTSTITVTNAVANGLTLTPTEGTVIVGTTLTLTARESYTDGRTEVVSTRATWTSSSGTRASVSGGVVTGLVAGDSPITITATVDGFSATASISVIAATISRINVRVEESASVPVGLTRQLSATATYNNGTSRDVTAEATWGSSSTTILTVSRASNANVAIATGRAVGNANATATIGSVVGSAAMTVTNAVVREVRMAPATLDLVVGQRGNVQLFALLSNDTEQNVTTSTATTWESENANIASVGSGGVVSANGASKVRLYGNYQGFRASTDVTVRDATISSLRITLGSSSIPAGTSTSVKVEALWNNNTTSDATAQAQWTTNNANRATVGDGASVVQAGRQTGVVSLTAEVGGVTASVTLTVTAATVTSLVVTPSENSVVRGNTVQLQAQATFSDGGTATVTAEGDTTWSTSDADVASMGRIKGSFSANSEGEATITATYRGASAKALITVNEPLVVEFWIEPSEFTLELGKELGLQAFGQLSNGQTTELTTLVKWSSGTPRVLGIDVAGRVTALSPGKAQLTATYDTFEAVSDGNVPDDRSRYSDIRMCPGSLSIAVGGVYGLAVMGLSEDDSLEDISNLVTWVPGSKSLSVDNTGKVTASAAFDSTTVDASYLDDTVSAKVDAYASDGVYLEASTAVARVEVGEDMQLRVSLVSVGKREDVTSQTTFDVGNDNIARVELDEKEGVYVIYGDSPGCTFVRVSHGKEQIDIPITVSGRFNR